MKDAAQGQRVDSSNFFLFRTNHPTPLCDWLDGGDEDHTAILNL